MRVEVWGGGGEGGGGVGSGGEVSNKRCLLTIFIVVVLHFTAQVI